MGIYVDINIDANTQSSKQSRNGRGNADIASKSGPHLLDRLVFVALLSALLAVVGAIMWYLDSPVANPGAQAAATEGLVIAMGGFLIPFFATVVHRYRHRL